MYLHGVSNSEKWQATPMQSATRARAYPNPVKFGVTPAGPRYRLGWFIFPFIVPLDSDDSLFSQLVSPTGSVQRT